MGPGKTMVAPEHHDCTTTTLTGQGKYIRPCRDHYEGGIIHMPTWKFAPLMKSDKTEVIDIFNHYIGNGFAAFPDQPVPYEFFYILLGLCQGYPSLTARDDEGVLQGFGMLRPHSPMPSSRGQPRYPASSPRA
jgi:hypothetical protein